MKDASRRQLLLIVVGASLLVVGTLDAAEIPSRVFLKEFALELRRARATRTPTDDAALALRMVESAELRAETPATAIYFCRQAMTLAQRLPAGEPVMLRGYRLLARLEPSKAPKYHEQAVALASKLADEAETHDEEALFDEIRLDLQLARARRLHQAKDWTNSFGAYRAAVGLANHIDSPRLGFAEIARDRCQEAKTPPRVWFVPPEIGPSAPPPGDPGIAFHVEKQFVVGGGRLAVAPDAETFIVEKSIYQRLHVGTVRTGKVSANLKRPSDDNKGVVTSGTHGFTIEFSPKLTHAAAITNGSQVVEWDLVKGGEPTVVEPPPVYPGSIRYRPDGRLWFAGNFDGYFGVWDVRDKAFVMKAKTTGRFWGVDLSPDGRFVWASASGVGSLYNVATGKLLLSVGAKYGAGRGFAWSPDGATLALPVRPRPDPGTGSEVWLVDLKTGDVRLKFTDKARLGGRLHYWSFGGEQWLAVHKSRAGQIDFFDVKTGEVAGQVDVQAEVAGVYFSRDGARMLTWLNQTNDEDENKLIVLRAVRAKR